LNCVKGEIIQEKIINIPLTNKAIFHLSKKKLGDLSELIKREKIKKNADKINADGSRNIPI
tara:strand:+ start:77 stop:259 length:183 start_codon:yes stop_codon:yes gene_type:complete